MQTITNKKNALVVSPETPFIKRVLADGTASLVGYECSIYPNRDTSTDVVEIRMGLHDTKPYPYKRLSCYIVGVNSDGSYSVEPNLTHYVD
jgi:hypothetical protein